MALLDLAAVGRYDSLYLSPCDGDAFVSCAARLHTDRTKGLRALVVSIFDGPAFRSPMGPTPRFDEVDTSSLALPRIGGLAGPSSGAGGTSGHGELRAHLTRVFEDLRTRLRPRHVFAPLGAGGQVAHGIVGECATAAFGSQAGRNVFLYEDRPEALVPGEVRLSLGLLGARLPAGAVGVADRSALLRYLARHRRGAVLRGEGGGPIEALRGIRPALARWRAASGWNPQKAFGPRLQPVLHLADAAAAALALETAAAVLPKARGGPSRFASQAAAYTRRLGASGYAERYWLLLPPIHGAEEKGAEPDLS